MNPRATENRKKAPAPAPARDTGPQNPDPHRLVNPQGGKPPAARTGRYLAMP